MLIVLGAACPPTVDTVKVPISSAPSSIISINFFFINLSPSKHLIALLQSHLNELDGMSCRALVSQLSSPCRADQAASECGELCRFPQTRQFHSIRATEAATYRHLPAERK